MTYYPIIYMWLIISHYKDPYEPISIMECLASVFFIAQSLRFADSVGLGFPSQQGFSIIVAPNSYLEFFGTAVEVHSRSFH